MKYFVIILLLFSCSTTSPTTTVVSDSAVVIAYVPYSFIWKTNAETGLVTMKVQKSANNINWINITSLLPNLRPDSNSYVCVLPKTPYSYWYRIYFQMISGSYNTAPIYLKSTIK